MQPHSYSARGINKLILHNQDIRIILYKHIQLKKHRQGKGILTESYRDFTFAMSSCIFSELA
jgi:hypothetical protein